VIEPSNDMIVVPFHHAYRNIFGMIAIRTDEDDFMLVSPSHYDPEHYPPGVLHPIIGSDTDPISPLPQRWRAFHLAVGTRRDWRAKCRRFRVSADVVRLIVGE
jgi:hypothetical protein